MVHTSLIKINSKNPESAKVQLAAKIILSGGLVAFPTETVYGLGANGLNPIAIRRIFSAKGRPTNNPLIMHIGSIDDLNNIAEGVTERELTIAKKFWPGPLTLILKKSKNVPRISTGGLESVAVRIPNNKISLSLIRAAGVPIAAPSANISGKPSPTRASHVVEDLWGKVDLILDGGRSAIGLESSVIDLTSQIPVLLRAGGVPYEKIRKVVGEISIHPLVTHPEKCSMGHNGTHKSPGMRYKHYSPKAELIIVEGSSSKVRNKIQELSNQIRKFEGKKVCIMSRSRNYGYYADMIMYMGSDFKTSGRNLYDILRCADHNKVDVIIAEGMEYKNLGLALMNRLKTAAKQVIKL
ncbi:MAG: L-threonylcarbamoyladenylate synthase [Candidatus Eiseniibacteriota bacterium]